MLILTPCSTKSRSDFQVYETAAHTMTEGGFWWRKTVSNFLRNGLETLSQHTVVLTVELGLSSEDFLIRENNLYRGRACLQLSENNFPSAKPFPLLEGCEGLTFLHFVWRPLEIPFGDRSHRYVADLHVICQLLYWPLAVPSYPLANSLNHLLGSTWAWSSTSWTILSRNKDS